MSCVSMNVNTIALQLALACAAILPLAAHAQSELDALIKAARAEGEVVFYSGPTENVARRTGDAFAAKYGVKHSFTRIQSAQAERRFGTEAEAGTFAIDFYLASTAGAFALEGIRKGWVEPVAGAGIPAIRGGEFPARFVTGPTAVIQIAPWGISYNTDKVKSADVPRDWTDMLDAKYRGQTLLPDPRSSDSYVALWSVLMDKYGESFLAKLREMNPRTYPSGVPAMNALGAGEGSLQVPSIAAAIQANKQQGAPVGIMIPSLTTGVEMEIVLVHRAKARHPNAARLFAHFVMTPEGNRIFNAEPGSISVFDTANMPKDYVSPKLHSPGRREQIARLLGFQ